MWNRATTITLAIGTLLSLGGIALVIYGTYGIFSKRDFETVMGNVTECSPSEQIKNGLLVVCFLIRFDYRIIVEELSGGNGFCTIDLTRSCPNGTISIVWNRYNGNTCLLEDPKCPSTPNSYFASGISGIIMIVVALGIFVFLRCDRKPEQIQRV